jgi:hypothetical protein
MDRFSDEQLKTMNIEMGGALHSVCPYCGSDLLLGRRRGTGALALVHAAMPDPIKGGREYISGCEGFRDLVAAQRSDILTVLRSSGARFERLTR